jgi:ankyrin repeat protein
MDEDDMDVLLAENVFLFCHYCQMHDWNQVRTFLDTITTDTKDDLRLLQETMQEVGQLSALEANHQNALHFLCSEHPPSDVVERLAIACPSFLHQPDIDGQLPLHTALANGMSNKKTVQTLVKFAHTQSCLEVCDNHGRTPLMLACRNINITTCERTVKYLLKACPRVINMEDEDGVNAIEFVIMTGSTDLCPLLREASQQEWRRLTRDMMTLSRNKNQR